MSLLRFHLALLAVLVGASLFAPGALAGTTTVQADRDAWVTDRYPTRNYGAQTVMRLNVKPLKRAFVRFTVPALDGPVEKAVLRLYATTGAPNGLRVFTTSGSWGELTITDANAPDAGTLVRNVPGFTARDTWREIDVTSAVNGAGVRAFLVTAPGASGDVYFNTRETARDPELVVTTSGDEPPPPPPPPPPTAPANTALPTVSGTARENESLSSTTGSWSGSTPMTYSSQWRRCDAAGASCVDVAGATGSSFTLGSADVGKTLRVRVTATNSAGSASAESAASSVVESAPGGGGTTPGTVITTDRPWNCRGSLRDFGPLPIKVVSTIANGSANDNDNAVSLRGCYGDGDDTTIDLILDIRGNGGNVGNGSVGTSYDAVRIGQDARELQVTGNAECGARNPNPSIHQDIVQALSGSNVTFVDFTSGDPYTGRWTCWGAGGGWYITWANAGRPTDLICLRCKLATYNQNLRIGDSLRSGARDSVFGYSRSYGIFVESVASSPVNVNNQVIRY